MSRYSSRYLQQQLGIGLQMWERFPDWEEIREHSNLPFSCFASGCSPGCRLMTNTRAGTHCAHTSRGLALTPGAELEHSSKSGDVVFTRRRKPPLLLAAAPPGQSGFGNVPRRLCSLLL